MWYKKVSPLLLPLILLLIGLYLTPLKLYEADFSKVPGDFGDARFNNYILEHDYKFFTGQIDNYWDAPFMYPYKNVIAFSDNLLGSAPIYCAYRIMGADRETAFQLWLLSLFVLNFICCYYVLKKWSKNNILSSVGAYIFAFSIFILGHLGGASNFPRFIVPFVCFWCWQYFNQKKPKYLLFTLLGIVYQFYCGIYLGLLLVYLMLFFFISYILIYRDRSLFLQFKNLKVVFSHIGIVAIAGALLTALMLPYIEISPAVGVKQFEPIINTIPTWRSYFFTSKAAIMWDCLSEHAIPVINIWWAHYMFIGIIPWLGVALVPFVFLSKKTESIQKKFLVFIFLSLFLSFIFCLNINGASLYKLIFHIPGFYSMRGMYRIINVEIILFVFVFVFVFNELIKKYKLFKWIVYSFPLLIIVDNLIDPTEVIRYDKKESNQQIEIIKNKILSEDYKKSFAVACISNDSIRNRADYHLNTMLAAQELNIPCVNAYTGYNPSSYSSFFTFSDEATLKSWCHLNDIDYNKILKIYVGTKIISKTIFNLFANNNKYVCADGGRNNIVIANREKPSQWETFTLLKLENNKYAISSYANKFFSADLGSTMEVAAIRDKINDWEMFELIALKNNIVAIKASNGLYLTVDEKTGKLYAASDSIGKNESFSISVK